MPANEMFRMYKDPGSITVGHTRRVYHSAVQKMSSTLGGATEEVVDKVAFGAATVNAACTVAVAAGAAGAFALAASGPFAAAGLGIVGIALTAKASYSNRDAAHKKLMPYVWSYIDDVAPKPITESDRKHVGAAALSLISDGQPQQKLLNAKYREREYEFNKFWRKYEKLSRGHEIYRDARMTPDARRRRAESINNRTEFPRRKHLDTGFKKGGALYEFMRRLGHMANYLQAPMVLGMVMQKDTKPLPDFATTVTSAKDVRESMRLISERIDKDDKTFEKIEMMLKTTRPHNHRFQR